MPTNKEHLFLKYLKGLKGKWALLLLLALALLCLVYGNAGQKKEEQATGTAMTAEEYRESLQGELSALLCEVRGVGRVRVLLTLSEKEEYVYAQNQSSGGSSYATPGGEALLLSVRLPKVSGVAVLCDGAENPLVEAEIVSLLTALLNIPSHKVSVSPMK